MAMKASEISWLKILEVTVCMFTVTIVIDISSIPFYSHNARSQQQLYSKVKTLQ